MVVTIRNPAIVADHEAKLERQWKAKMLWQERDGTMNAIPNMTDTHLLFAIVMVQRGIKERKFWRADQLPFLMEEKKYRALMAKKGAKHG